MKRYMICPVIGTGQGGPGGNPYRAAVADVSGANVTSLIKSDHNTGAPLYNFAFCRVATAGSFASAAAVSNSYTFPDFPLDAQLSQMDADVRAAMVQSVPAYDLDGQGLHLTIPNGDTDSFRTVIIAVAQQFEPAFNADNFDVSEPTQ